ncbi:response regulator (plasmid) [Sinorhizobium meliloti]|uniref:Response regulatory domain-containing protein n=2 Tax=Rhizobium meliloti TaxID=382 RepID=Q931D3_RHIME|nr:hypothetical protein SMa0021 [Sinorhizobium meliloti 1021]ASP60888.1 response regulator [Sinorhizobium meliloti]RVL39879.1 response regulator [Sinorhizobium meliloti]RVL87894.1 response regulator [Sinorhizobium meliloti]RVN09154.1 response regulator [Sinorhizobium meliloti]
MYRLYNHAIARFSLDCFEGLTGDKTCRLKAQAWLIAELHQLGYRDMPQKRCCAYRGLRHSYRKIAKEPRSEQTSSCEEADMKPATILLAEDEALLLLDYEAALADAGFVVVAVARGGKAIEVWRSADSEVAGVATDIRFYELPNGWSVARVAREIYPGIPIVYGTGHGALEWRSRGVANSILLEKPFALAQLVTAVSELLNEPVLLSVAPDPNP